MKLLILDNYDSFTYNLAHLISKVSNTTIDVFKNDEIGLAEVKNYDKIVLSPGPGLPADAGIMPQLIQTYASSKSIFGVCLGMQAIAECFGSTLKNLDTVYHGIATPVTLVATDPIFSGCPESFKVGRYHSWGLDKNNLSQAFEVTALDAKNLVMALRHKTYDIKGVQFHPESILSEYGEVILSNWLNTGVS